MEKDVLAEMMTAVEGSVRCSARVYLTGGRTIDSGQYKTIIGGVLITDTPINQHEQEMWECDIILIPKKKHKGPGVFHGHRIDQVLTFGYEDPEKWDGCFFGRKGDKG